MTQADLSSVAITAHAAACIRAASLAAGSHEACGLLFGQVAHVIEASVARNVAADPARCFEIDPAALFAAHRRGREGPLALIGVWHSHTNGTLFPSALDAAGVTDPAWLWLIESGGKLAGFLPDSSVPARFRPICLAEGGPAAI